MTAAANDELLAGFIDEAAELLKELPDQLGQFHAQPDEPAPVHSVFRSVHTIKGNAGFFGLIVIKQFAHSVENTLDNIRAGQVSMSDDLFRALIEAFDSLDEMVGRVQEGTIDDELDSQQADLLERIEKLAQENSNEQSVERQILDEVLKLADQMEETGIAEAGAWIDSLRNLVVGFEEPDGAAGSSTAAAPTAAGFAAVDFASHGEDVTAMIRNLLEMFVASDAGEYTEEKGVVFMEAAATFADWAESVGEAELAATVYDTRHDFRTIFESPLEVDPLLISIIWEKLVPVLMKLADSGADAAPADESPGTPLSGDGSDKPNAAASEGSRAPTKNRYLRVKEERVDAFLDDVSSLFITCERLKELQARMTSQLRSNDLVDELRQINATFGEQSNALQKSVVALRRVPARGLFSKFPRLARTLAGNLGKQVDIHMEGEETEIDKTLIDDLDGPLTHMIRNVCDHGIESPAERAARGVSETGNLWLRCDLTRSHVVITIQDDGRGIDPNALRRKAVEKGIMTEAQVTALPDEAAVELIFHPGFSTAQTISEISGRGVGLDVVRTTLREHDGEVHVSSVLGEGTTFRLEIPIRQAVLVVDGLLVRQGDETFVIPFEFIREIFELQPHELSTVHGSPVTTIRGEPYAAAYLAELLNLPRHPLREGELQKGVLVTCKEGTMCLLVDNVMGQRKAVINSLDTILPGREGMSGVSPLGGGQLALVLNPIELIQKATRR